MPGCASPPVVRTERRLRGGITLGVVVAEGGVRAARRGRRYRGRLETIRRDGREKVVNYVSMEDYVKGVLPGEVLPGWPPEALKAMAVVARTYAWSKWQKAGEGSYQLIADTRDQEYCGLSCEDKRSNRAVTNTAGIVLVWEGKALPAYCHSCCAGSTEDVREVWGGPPVPPLEGVECRWCASAKHFGPWNFVIGREKLARRLAPETGGVREIGRLRTAGETASGRVRWVMVDAGSREVRISGAKFRMLVGYNDLRSARFTITDRDDSVKFSGTGWGHGVGLCQEGACAMAKKGKSFTEIVRYYFPGTVLKRLKR